MDAAILGQIRDWVGSQPDDATVESFYSRLGNGTVETAALSILRQRRADLEANPETFNVQGDYSQSTGKNLDSLNSRIGQLEALTGYGGDVLTTGVLARCDDRAGRY